MEIKALTIEFLDEVERIYASARQFMKNSGNPNQWRDTYPLLTSTLEDIETGILYGVFQEEELCGVFAFLDGPDPAYDTLVEGEWLNSRPYRAIHRVASDGKVRGVFNAIADFCKKDGRDLRIDTHRDNHPMQRVLEKNGFIKCGVVEIRPSEMRVTYHWIHE